MTSGVDIWSFSAVLSEACIWVVYGKEGLNYYRRERGAATETIADFRAGNCFHDGYNVLKEVEKTHNMAQHDRRHSDFLTHEVWLQLIKPNLVSRPEARSDATTFWKLTASILADAKAMRHCPSLSRKEFLQPPTYGVGTLPRSLSDPVVQFDGGLSTDSLAIRRLTGCQTVNEDTLDQGFQEQLNMQSSGHVDSLQYREDEPRYGSVSQQDQKTNGHLEPSSPGNGFIRSRGISYSRSLNSKGRTTFSDEDSWPAEEAIRWVKTKSDHKSEFSRREEELKKFGNSLDGRDHVCDESLQVSYTLIKASGILN